MTGVDTNVLVRYLVQDDAAQARKAAAFLERENASGFFLGQVVLCELVWVLSFAYGYRKVEIMAVLRQLLRTAQFVIEGPEAVRRAIDRYDQGSGDLSDFLILESALEGGCDSVVTFDRKLHRTPGFSSP